MNMFADRQVKRDAFDSLELRVKLEEAIAAYKSDPLQIPLGVSFAPVHLAPEIPYFHAKELADILLVVDEWSNPDFWNRKEIVAQRILVGEQWAFIDEDGVPLAFDRNDPKGTTDGTEHDLFLAGSPWREFQQIRALILTERPDVLFFIGQNVREDKDPKRCLEILTEIAEQNGTDTDCPDAARRALAVLVVCETLNLNDLPSPLADTLWPQLQSFQFSKHLSNDAPQETSDEKIKTLIETHPTKLDPDSYLNIASHNGLLKEAYAQLRKGLYDPESDINIRIQCFEKYLALNQALIKLLPLKSKSDLEQEFMFLLMNPDLSHEIAPRSVITNAFGSHQVALVLGEMLESQIFHREALEYLVRTGTLADDGTPYRIALLTALTTDKASVEEAYGIAEEQFGKRAADALVQEVNKYRRIGVGELTAGAVSLFQFGEVKKAPFENVPLDLFQPPDKIIVDSAIAEVQTFLKESLYSELQDKFTQNAAQEVQSLRKYITGMSDDQFRRWALPYVTGEHVSLELCKKAWVVNQLAQRCIRWEVEPSDKLKKAIGTCFATATFAYGIRKRRPEKELGKKIVAAHVNFIGILLRRNPEPLERLFLMNMLDPFDQDTHPYAALSANPFKNPSEKDYPPYLEERRLLFRLPDYGFISPTRIHQTDFGTFADVPLSATRSTVRYNLDRLSDGREYIDGEDPLPPQKRVPRFKLHNRTLRDENGAPYYVRGKTLEKCSQLFESPNGDRTYVIGNTPDGERVLVDLEGNSIAVPYSLDSSDDSTVKFSPDGTQAIADYYSHGRRLLWDLTSRRGMQTGREKVEDFFFGGENSNTAIALLCDGDTSRLVQFQSGPQITIKHSFNEALIRVDEKLLPDSKRYKVMQVTPKGKEEWFHAIFDLKNLRFIDLKNLRFLSNQDIFESPSGERLWIGISKAYSVFTIRECIPGAYIRIDSEGQIDAQLQDIPGMFLIGKDSTFLDAPSSLLNNLNYHTGMRYFSQDPNRPEAYYVISKFVLVGLYNKNKLPYRIFADNSLPIALTKDPHIQTLFPVPNQSEVYGLSTPIHVGRKQVIKLLSPDKDIFTFTGFDATFSEGTMEPVFSPDGADQYLVISHDATKHQIYDLKKRRSVRKNNLEAQLDEPSIAYDGKNCFITALPENDTDKRETYVLWWRDSGVVGRTREEVEALCRPKKSDNCFKQKRT